MKKTSNALLLLIIIDLYRLEMFQSINYGHRPFFLGAFDKENNRDLREFGSNC